MDREKWLAMRNTQPRRTARLVWNSGTQKTFRPGFKAAKKRGLSRAEYAAGIAAARRAKAEEMQRHAAEEMQRHAAAAAAVRMPSAIKR